MALQQQQEEFRQYLDDVGILKIIYQGLKAVYAQNPEERPKDALQFFMGQMNLDVTENPRAAEIDDLKRQVQDLQRKYEELQAKYDAVKASSSPSKTPTTPEVKSEEADAPANSDGS